MKVAILSFGEGVPTDEKYRPGRYGRLAAYLHEQGHEVVRITPSFGHYTRRVRPIGSTETVEGTSTVVKTNTYESNRSLRRLTFVLAFVRGAARTLRKERPDAVVIAVPPPFMTLATRLALGRGPTIVADLRDLWPEALAPSASGLTGRIVALGGRFLALELFVADACVGLSRRMLNRSPVSRQRAILPIGIDAAVCDPTRPPPSGPLKICYLGNLGKGLDFEPLLAALDGVEFEWQFDVYGRGPRVAELSDRLKELDGAEFLGELDATLVPETMAKYDVGVVPRVTGFGTCLPNKVFEYLGCGLRVLFRLEPGVGDDLVQAGLGQLCTTADDWRRALEEANQSLHADRGSRTVRMDKAVELFTTATIHRRFEVLLAELSGTTEMQANAPRSHDG